MADKNVAALEAEIYRLQAEVERAYHEGAEDFRRAAITAFNGPTWGLGHARILTTLQLPERKRA